MTNEFKKRWLEEIAQFLAIENTLKDEFDDRRRVTNGKCWWWYNRHEDIFMMMSSPNRPNSTFGNRTHVRWYYLGTTEKGHITEVAPGKKLKEERP